MSATILMAVGAFIVGATIYLTITRYGELPERIPIHFGITGSADGFGPRWMAWFIVAAQMLAAAAYVAASLSGALCPRSPGSCPTP